MSDSEESSCGTDWPVTEEWLQVVLKEHHKNLPNKSAIIVENFNVRPGCDVGESVLSDILAVTVKYRFEDEVSDKTFSESFIIKLLPQDPFSRFFVTEAQFDLREIKFYTQIVPDLEKFQSEHIVEGSSIALPIPKCFYANYSSGSNEPQPIPPESVLVLENIKPLNFVSAEFSRGLNLRQATAALESVAQIHALSLSFKIKEDKALTDRYPFLFQTSKATDSYQQLVERGLPQLAQFLEKRPGLENVIECLNLIRPKTKDIIELLLSPEEPMSLITHTDFWCNNLMFKEENDACECIILDWQMVTYSRPTNDLALLLISSTPSEIRRTQTEFLLDKYWEALTNTCSKVGLNIESDLKYDRNRLGEDYKRSQLLAVLLCIGSVDVALGDPLTEERLLELLKDLYEDGIFSQDVINNI